MDVHEFTRGEFDVSGAELFAGREHNVEMLEQLLASVTTGAATAVISGEVGIGKSALLRRVARTCTARMLWVRGSESESMIPFACAADLLTPLREYFDELPATQRRALEVALAVSAGPPP